MKKLVAQKQSFEISSRRRRFGAFLIDKLCLAALLSIAAGLLSFSTNDSLTLGIASLISISYFSLFLTSSWWATPGQRLLGIYVCAADSFKQISLLAAVVRFLIFKALVVVSIIIALVFSFGSLKQAVEKMPNLYNKSLYSKDVYIKDLQDNTSRYFRYSSNRVEANDEGDYIEGDVLKEPDNNKKPKANSDAINTVVIGVELHRASGSVSDSEYYDYQSQQQDFEAHEYLNFLRVLAHSMSIFSSIYVALLIIPTFFGNKKQTVYDLICNTCVVIGKK